MYSTVSHVCEGYSGVVLYFIYVKDFQVYNTVSDMCEGYSGVYNLQCTAPEHPTSNINPTNAGENVNPRGFLLACDQNLYNFPSS